MYRLKDDDIFTDIGTGSHSQTTHQTGGQIRDDVAVQIGQNQNVVNLGFLH